MGGQGCPNTIWSFAMTRPAGAVRGFAARIVSLRQLHDVRVYLTTLFLLVASHTALAADATVHLRIVWGGGTEQTWHGTIAIDRGQLANPMALGIEADEPGSIYFDNGHLEIRSRSPRAYDGVDLAVTAPQDAKLSVSLGTTDAQHDRKFELTLSELIAKQQSLALDANGNRLIVRRASHDMLRVNIKRPSLVFRTGENWQLEVQPTLAPITPGATVQLRTRIVGARGGVEVWSGEQAVTVPTDDGPIPAMPLEVRLPATEGVYDLVLELAERSPLRWNRAVVQRRVQLVVLGEASPVAADESNNWTTLLEIDPAAPYWLDRVRSWPRATMAMPSMAAFRRGPVDSGSSSVVPHALGSVARLDSLPQGTDPHRRTEPAWGAYPLSISRPGQPHILEVEYPADVPQTVGISIVEPNAAGAVTPIGLDSGFYTSEEVASSAGSHWQMHRLTFWPRTKNPVVLITNQDPQHPAMFGKLRVLSGPTTLSKAKPPQRIGGTRQMVAYLDRPLLPENFGGSESLDPWSDRSLDDWQTFYEGTTRLVQYLEHAGCGGLMINVLADGSSIYPSEQLQPTPRYDTGMFFDLGLDPVRKDVLELLLQLTDRAALQLIPSLQFTAPLPALEQLRRTGSADAVGLEPIGPEGQTWTQTYAPDRGQGPYYNVLDPRVQDAMLAAVRELVMRYGKHPSLAGLGIDLSGNGYAILPGELWGLDDRTIAAFQKATGARVPGEGPERFATRAQFLAGEGRAAWLTWRGQVLAEFQGRLRGIVTDSRPDRKLYLLTKELYASPEIKQNLRPTLPNRSRLEEAMSGVGLLSDALVHDSSIVLLRSQQVEPPATTVSQSLAIEQNRSVDLDRLTNNSPLPAALIFHEPRRLRIKSFDTKSPFPKTHTWLVSQLSPSGIEQRRAFAQCLAAIDPLVMFDGGWLLPLGQEDSLADMLTYYRNLPGMRFRTFDGNSSPITARFCTVREESYIYLVNNSPWVARISVDLQSPRPCSITDLADKTPPLQFAGGSWNVQVEPFGLVAVRCSAPDVRPTAIRVDADTNTARAQLEQRLTNLRQRRVALESPPYMSPIVNNGFEQPLAEKQSWALVDAAAGKISIAATEPHSGDGSCLLASEGRIASLRSATFAAPTTGRLAVSVWLKAADVQKQPPLRLAIEGTVDGKTYYRYAPIGASPATQPLPGIWSHYLFPVDDLPAEGLSELRVRFDLMGAGQVWIDDVQLFDLAFSETERIHLSKVIAQADGQLQAGHYAECLHDLDGYWPRFMLENVKLPVAAQSQAQTPPPAAPPSNEASPAVQAPPPARQGVFDRVRDLWKR